MIRVPVDPGLIRWARARSRISYETLATKFKRLPEWEDGVIQPTLRRIEAFAHAVHVPVGYLFLSEPPEEAIPIPDFRDSSRRPGGAAESQPARYHLRLSGTPGLVSGLRPDQRPGGAGLRRQRHACLVPRERRRSRSPTSD